MVKIPSINILYTIILLTSLFSCKQESSLFITKEALSSGIDFQNTLSETDDFNILDYLYFYNGGGVAVGDINNDGLVDIYFSGNQVKNKLYLNKGNLEFKDITEKAGVKGNSDWNTCAVMGDVNGDGLLDIYVCAVVGLKGLNGKNELFINEGDGQFSEQASQFGLDFSSYNSSAAFLDYDLDGDLDMFLLNHAVHTQESFGHADQRLKRKYSTGDKLLRNENGTFQDISEEAGIYGGVNGYGLGLAIADFNCDGFPDIYVGNDFHEDDYYYLNNGDGTFSDRLKDSFGHTSRFSMGGDVADINHDAYPDLLMLDMLPDDERVLKNSAGDESANIQRIKTQQYGYYYQYSRNMLQINNETHRFYETALLSGVASTDWSWSALFADYDQDTHQDLFISNGIPKRPNNLDYIRFVSSDQIKMKIDVTKLVDQQALNMMPSGAVRNYIFKGNGNLKFVDKSDTWIPNKAGFSSATAMSDLDNDGDLDLIINNINGPPSLYINQTDNNANYLKLSFNLDKPNRFGIGTKVYAYHNGTVQYKELYTTRGFQASSEPIIHFGFGNILTVDSLKVEWFDHTTQVYRDIPVNQTLILSPSQATLHILKPTKKNNEKLFTPIANNLGINFQHTEDRYIDFNRQKLMPYQISDRGPATAIGDLNGDGKLDLFFGSSKFYPSAIFIQKEHSFEFMKFPIIASDSIKEDVSAIIADLNKDGKNDLLIGSGGGDFYNQMQPLLDSYFLQSDTGFYKANLPDYFENASVIKACDYDLDGELEVFVGNQAISNDFGKKPRSYLLENKQGMLFPVENQDIRQLGMVTNAIWSDYNQDGATDLIVVGEWMSPTFLKNENGNLKKDPITEDLNGLWQTVYPYDMDKDGKMDYALGNWGLNSKFKASSKYPLKMYYGDIDENGDTETILALAKKGKYYPLEGLDELSSQIINLRKKFVNYKDFAGLPIEQVFSKKELDRTLLLQVKELRSGYLKNENGKFKFYPFPIDLQVSPITAFVAFDFDDDHETELLAGGNYFGVKPFHGRFDAFSGALIHSNDNIQPGYEIGLEFLNKAVRNLNVINVGKLDYLIATINNEKIQVYKLKKSK